MNSNFCPVKRELCKHARYNQPARHGVIKESSLHRAEMGGEYACAFSSTVKLTKTLATCPKEEES